MAKCLVINDVSELKKDAPIIRAFLDVSGLKGHKMVAASSVRKKVFGWLEKDTGKKGRYDLVLLGDRGGTLLFDERRLLDFGKRVVRLPYSTHYADVNGWKGHLGRELAALGKAPKILLLEGDVGEQGFTVGKINTALGLIKSAKWDADMRVVAGAANTRALEIIGRMDYAAHRTDANPRRLSEIVEKSDGLFVRTMRGIQAKRRLTGTLPH